MDEKSFRRVSQMKGTIAIEVIILFSFIFQNNVLPSGEKSKKGLSMVIRDVTRHHAGTYTCTANNNVGKPHTAEIDLRVLCKLLAFHHQLNYCWSHFFKSIKLILNGIIIFTTISSDAKSNIP